MDYFKLLRKIKNKKQEKIFLVIDEKSYTYKEVYNATKLLINKLRNMKEINNYEINEGCKKIVLVYSDDLYFQIIGFFAINGLEDIPIIAHHNLPQEFLNKIIENNNIKYVLSDKEFNYISKKADNLKYENEFRNYEDEAYKNIFLYEIKSKIDSIHMKHEICMGALTSGSTDVPKVLYRTYESWAGFFHIQNEIFNINSDSKIFINGSLSFTGNLNVIMSVLYEGGSIISLTEFKCKEWIKIFEEEQVTNIYLVPSKLKMLNKLIKKQIYSVKGIFTGSELLFMDTADKLKETFPNSEIKLYYGASELNYITYITHEEMYSNPLSVGRSFPNVDIFIKNDFIYVNTKYHVEGITNPCTVYDVGHIDNKGYLIFEGRKDDIINKGGMKISSIKIEAEINKISGVKENVVMAYADDKKGNEIVAFVVANIDVTKEYIIKNLKNKIMNVEIPKKIIFIESIPRNSSGKIDKLFINNIPIFGQTY